MQVWLAFVQAYLEKIDELVPFSISPTTWASVASELAHCESVFWKEIGKPQD